MVHLHGFRENKRFVFFLKSFVCLYVIEMLVCALAGSLHLGRCIKKRPRGIFLLLLLLLLCSNRDLCQAGRTVCLFVWLGSLLVAFRLWENLARNGISRTKKADVRSMHQEVRSRNLYMPLFVLNGSKPGIGKRRWAALLLMYCRVGRDMSVGGMHRFEYWIPVLVISLFGGRIECF